MAIENMYINTDSEGVVKIYSGTAPKLLDPYEYKGFQYKALSLFSFVSLVKSKGSMEKSVIFHNELCFHAILDDTIMDRRHDTITYQLSKSLLFDVFSKILVDSAAFSVPEFAKFLKRLSAEEIPAIEKLLYGVQNFKYVQNLSGDFSYNNNNDYTFCIKSSGVEQTLKIPQSFSAEIEIFKDSGFFQTFEIEIEIEIPKSQNDGPYFVLSCPKYKYLLEKALKNQVLELAAEFDGWLVVAGQPNNFSLSS